MYQKHYSESQNIKRSMIVLSLSLVLVYIVLYYAKWDLWTKDANISVINTWDVVISELNNDWDVVNNTKNIINNVDDKWDLSEPDELIWDLEFNSDELEIVEINDDKDQDDIDEGEDTRLLSGTKTYYGELDFVDTLWISYEYALKDDKNIYYLNMWEYDYDFSDIARKLKWNLYVMNTEQELIANGLFGEKVTYINIPEYKDQKVLILLEIDNGSWLLAIDYSIYHQVKPYLKTLFID